MARRIAKALAGRVFYRTKWLVTTLGERLGSERLNLTTRWFTCPSSDCPAQRAADSRGGGRDLFRRANRADVGCGAGTIAAELARQPQWQVVGVECDSRLRKKATAKGVHVHAFDLSKNTDPLSEAPFDVAVSFEMAEHIPARPRAPRRRRGYSGPNLRALA